MGLDEEDIILEKKYYDLFSNPQLLSILQTKETKTVVVTGLYTEVCVFGTVERAFTEGYHVIVPTDLVGSIDERTHLREAALEIMSNYLADVVNSDRLLD
ncbi:MAG: isochorismatase family cysteine hydrolase [Patescibacteria group bacterium]